MATNISTDLTLLELAERSGDEGAIMTAEILTQRNKILQVMPWLPHNVTGGYKFNQETSLPEGTLRAVNEGVGRQKSNRAPITEPSCRRESWSEVDEYELADMDEAGKAVYINTEQRAIIRGMGNGMASDLFYGNRATTIREINGFATRTNDVSQSNVTDGGGTGSDLSSVYVVELGEDTCHMIYPKSGTIGMEMNFFGKIRSTEDTDGSKRLMMYSTQFILQYGLVVKDTSAVQRICNIETTGASNILDVDDVINAIRRLPGVGTPVFMSNTTILAQLDIQAKDKPNVLYTVDNPFGDKEERIRNLTVYQTDAILNTESQVT